MELKVLPISISYSSVKWPALIEHIRLLFLKYPIEAKLLFFNTDKGDVVRLVLFYQGRYAKSIEVSLVQNIKDFLKEQPSKRNQSNLKPGECLWMNYPNNQLYLNNFRVEDHFIKETTEENNIFSFSTRLSSWLISHPLSKEEMISTFMQLIILVNRFFLVEKIADSTSELIDSIEEKFELKQQPNILSEIYRHADEDLQFNSDAITQLILCKPLSEFYSAKYLEFDSLLHCLDYNRKDFLLLYKQIMNKLIVHLGLDYRVQLYVLLMIKNCWIQIENNQSPCF